ncbi:MAG: ComF family protein, partial [Candidatus Marinimicrobia bacterium]|nr:ComF family protein [Candidatus Neomarinimicrobiota bacterium]
GGCVGGLPTGWLGGMLWGWQNLVRGGRLALAGHMESRRLGCARLVGCGAAAWRGGLETVQELLYPRRCAVCGDGAPGAASHLCDLCRHQLEFIAPPFCRVCGDPVAGHFERAYTCLACTARPPAFDVARSLFRYSAGGELVRQLKYQGGVWLAPMLGEWLAAAAQTHLPLERLETVAPVPLHPVRRRERSYNQSELLARSVARALGLPHAPRLLRRVRPTETQTHLTAAARRHNVEAAFAVREARWVQGRRVLLVDDVMTTGATVDACARALKQAGAARVFVLTAARGG